MNPALILFGIKAVIRLAKAGQEAYSQSVQDAPIIFPTIDDVATNRYSIVSNFFKAAGYSKYVKPGTEYAEYWDQTNNTPIDVDTLFIAVVKIQTEDKEDDQNGEERIPERKETAAGLIFVKQWSSSTEPLSPIAKVIMTAGDIALEYIGSNPSILGVGGNGEKLLGAFATNLSDLLPNNGNYGPQERFTERLLGVTLKAGFKTVNDNSEWVTNEEHLEKLISATVKPIVENYPQTGITEAMQYEKLADVLIGPAAGAAMNTLAQNPDAYFGDKFEQGTAFGALTKGLLEAAAKKDGLKDQFDKEGLLELYTAALDVAVKQPEVFIGHGAGNVDELSRDLLTNCATKLKAAKPPFNGRVGTQLAAAVMNAVSENAHNFVGTGKQWEQTAGDIIEEITRDLGGAFEQNKNLKTVFNNDQLIDIGRIVLTRVSSTPAMILGPKEAVGEVVSAIAQAMAADDKLLLSGNDWIEIAKVAANEAAKNPARLFKLDTTNNNQALAADLMKGILNKAGEFLEQPVPPAPQRNLQYSVLFGSTLKEVIVTVIQHTSGNPQQAKGNQQKVFDLIGQVNTFVEKNPDKFGNKEWLKIFKKLLSGVLNGENPPDLTESKALELLS